MNHKLSYSELAHPARIMPFSELMAGLTDAKLGGQISERIGPNGLRLYCYTNETVYSRSWNQFSLMSRGLIVDVDRECVVATPFPKFFNLGESGDTSIPNIPFEVFEKLDGSMITIFWHNEKWCCATKGSFESDQAKWAEKYLTTCDLSKLRSGTTYIAEAIYPENRIVIQYDYAGLVLLAAWNEDGVEESHDHLIDVADSLNWRIAERQSFESISELIRHTKTLPKTEEGFVIRFADGLRLKLKGDEYCRIHSMISRVTPLAIWESMQAGDDLEAIRRDLPEEFWKDFDTILNILNHQIANIVADVADVGLKLSALSDKEVGLQLNTFSDHVRKLIFPYRKRSNLFLEPGSRRVLYQFVRPTRNELAGYVSSSSIHRFEAENA